MITSSALKLINYSIHITQRSGSLPVIMFLHGNSMSSKVWQKQFESNELKPYHLIAIDLPGHGGSTNSNDPDRDYNLPGYVEVLLECIARLKIDKFFIVGHSLGANISIEALSKLRGCSGLFLVGPSIATKPVALDKLWLPNPALSALFKDECTGQEIEAYIQILFKKNNAFIPDFIKEDFIRTDKNARAYFGKSVAEGKYEDEVQILQRTAVPVAIVAGMDEQIVNNEYLAGLDIPKWRDTVELIPQTGHTLQWENPHELNHLLISFIEFYK